MKADSLRVHLDNSIDRLTLGYKGIPYTTEWVEYPDIEAKCKEIGIVPGETKADGSPFYTLPAIWDPSTKTGVSESTRIAEYLDKAYPDTPRVWFGDIEEYDYITTLPEFISLRSRFTLPLVYKNFLNPASQEHFRRSREASLGRKLEELTPVGKEREEIWSESRKAFDVIDGLVQKSGGPYIRGKQASFVDFALGGYLIWFKVIWGEDSDLWRDVSIRNNGRCGRYVKNLERFVKPIQSN